MLYLHIKFLTETRCFFRVIFLPRAPKPVLCETSMINRKTSIRDSFSRCKSRFTTSIFAAGRSNRKKGRPCRSRFWKRMLFNAAWAQRDVVRAAACRCVYLGDYMGGKWAQREKLSFDGRSMGLASNTRCVLYLQSWWSKLKWFPLLSLELRHAYITVLVWKSLAFRLVFDRMKIKTKLEYFISRGLKRNLSIICLFIFVKVKNNI